MHRQQAAANTSRVEQSAAPYPGAVPCPRCDALRSSRAVPVTVKCPSVQELLELQEKCAAAGLNTYLIRDAGHTEIEPGSRTVLAVGPAYVWPPQSYTTYLCAVSGAVPNPMLTLAARPCSPWQSCIGARSIHEAFETLLSSLHDQRECVLRLSHDIIR